MAQVVHQVGMLQRVQQVHLAHRMVHVAEVMVLLQE